GKPTRQVRWKRTTNAERPVLPKEEVRYEEAHLRVEGSRADRSAPALDREGALEPPPGRRRDPEEPGHPGRSESPGDAPRSLGGNAAPDGSRGRAGDAPARDPRRREGARAARLQSRRAASAADPDPFAERTLGLRRAPRGHTLLHGARGRRRLTSEHLP